MVDTFRPGLLFEHTFVDFFRFAVNEILIFLKVSLLLQLLLLLLLLLWW